MSEQTTKMSAMDSLSHMLEHVKHKTKPCLSFISAGIGCHALTIIEKLGILSHLVNQGFFSEEELEDPKKFNNPLAIKTACSTLCMCHVLSKKGKIYTLTELGIQLTENIGLITMLFEGYGELLAKSSSIALGHVLFPEKLMKGAEIAFGSIQFGEETVDPFIIEIIQKLNITGRICDLGCGSAHRLKKVCQALSLPGLGLDSHPDAIKMAIDLTKDFHLINIEQADVTNLLNTWDDVEVIMQSFMTHDIVPAIQCVKVLNSYKKNFPNLKYFIIVDIVAPDDHSFSHMPGYDYVHGLLGIETRNYKNTIQTFTDASYEIVDEIILSIPNSYIWVLK